MLYPLYLLKNRLIPKNYNISIVLVLICLLFILLVRNNSLETCKRKSNQGAKKQESRTNNEAKESSILSGTK